MDLLLDVLEAAKAMKVCTKTIRKLQKSGELPCVHIGTRVLFDPRALQRWIESKTACDSPVQVQE